MKFKRTIMKKFRLKANQKGENYEKVTAKELIRYSLIINKIQLNKNFYLFT